MTQQKSSRANPAGDEQLKQTTIRLPRSLHRRVVMRCAELEVTLQDVMVEKLRQFVGDKAAA